MEMSGGGLTPDALIALNEKAGKLYNEKKFKEALDLFDSLSDVPKELKPNHAKLNFYCGNARKALDIMESIDFDGEPDPETLIDYGLYLGYNNREDEAYFLFKELAEKGNQKAKFNNGWHELLQGNFKEGFASLQAGVDLNVWGNELAYVNQGILNRNKKWDGKSKVNKLLFILEGGAGDQIIFFRFIQEAVKSCNHIIIAAPQDMMRLLHDSLYFWSLTDDFTIVPLGAMAHIEYDAYLSSFQSVHIMDLDNPCRVEPGYIQPGKEAFIEHPLESLRRENGRPLIAAKYFGNQKYEHETFRKFPEERMMESLIKRGNVVNLQLDDDKYYNRTIPVNGIVNDWKSTACIINACDLVVSSCTAIAHVSAAMGKQTVVIVPKISYFVWAAREENMQWYGNNVKIIRQAEFGTWDNCFDELDLLLDSLGYIER